jgi:NADH-quinone oxidoreductase subunit N
MAATYDSVGLEDAFFGSVTYILIYAFMNLGAFAAVIAASARVGSGEIDEWGGLGRYSPSLAAYLTMFFFALAGIPPLAGWFAKFVMFRAVIGAFSSPWAIVLASIAAVNAVIALVYYARVVKTVYMDPVPEHADADSPTVIAPSLKLALVITAVVVIVAGFFPQILGFFGEASRALASGW